MSLTLCANCRNEIGDKAAFCQTCGHPVHVASQPGMPPPLPPAPVNFSELKFNDSRTKRKAEFSWMHMPVSAVVVLAFILFGLLGLAVLKVLGVQTDPAQVDADSAIRTVERAVAQAERSAGVQMAPSQIEFNSISSKCSDDYSRGINELQKSLVFNACNESRYDFFNRNPEVHGWVGKVKSIRTDQGADYVSVVIYSNAGSAEIEYQTEIGRVFDNDNTMLRPFDKEMLDVLAGTRIGEDVRFDGRFIRRSSATSRDMQDTSVTEMGSMTNPEYSFKFSKFEAL